MEKIYLKGKIYGVEGSESPQFFITSGASEVNQLIKAINKFRLINKGEDIHSIVLDRIEKDEYNNKYLEGLYEGGVYIKR